MPQALIQTVSLIFGLVVLAFVYYLLYKEFKAMRKRRKTAQHISEMKWLVLEFKIPKENVKSPQAMEQVFASLHAISDEDWFSVEIVGFSHSTHFLIRIPEQYHDLVQAAVFAQYPDANNGRRGLYRPFRLRYP